VYIVNRLILPPQTIFFFVTTCVENEESATYILQIELNRRHSAFAIKIYDRK